MTISKQFFWCFFPTLHSLYCADTRNTCIQDVFLGGVDTSAVTVSWAMTELIKNPEVMKKVQEEIRSYDLGMKGKVEESDLHQFIYLKMVITETMRLHPPGPLLLPRESKKL
ncbi:cytochrome P450 71A1-like [Papaver somniferum]|uniref:cytochrome P450 71A1-like n=1 Tax=Papaver somniferum TaxID=3469 RepID=UPI000E6FE1BA|nr:cytochrome P450 71A1-like [Papaver somniferum]